MANLTEMKWNVKPMGDSDLSGYLQQMAPTLIFIAQAARVFYNALGDIRDDPNNKRSQVVAEGLPLDLRHELTVHFMDIFMDTVVNS